MSEWEFSKDFDCWIWRPLVSWHAADVAAIHDEFGLDVNPLYHLGATRVGCFPCIHARKAELALVARLSPERIDQIEAKERELNERGAARDAAFVNEDGTVGRPFMQRTMFSFHNGASQHFPLPIREAVAWARSARGEWQPDGEDGCARFGFCSANPEPEPEQSTQESLAF